MEKNMKKFALFIGCNIPAKVEQYETSSRAVFEKLEIDIVDIKAFNCCGYPLKNTDKTAWLLASARNIALAEKNDLNILTLCKCCFGSLKKANAVLAEDSGLTLEMNTILKKEGLNYQGTSSISHYLSVLHNDITVTELDKRTIDHYNSLNIATHYGCHALRPSNIMEFDDPVNPTLFDNLVEATGANSIDWASKLDCCGAPVLGINDQLSYDLTHKKLTNAKKAGADFICVACPWCHMQFDKIQDRDDSTIDRPDYLPSILYPQLLGLRLGISKEALGIPADQSFSKLFDVKEKKVKKAKKA
jgi:heterodisulfide reductase subunit B